MLSFVVLGLQESEYHYLSLCFLGVLMLSSAVLGLQKFGHHYLSLCPFWSLDVIVLSLWVFVESEHHYLSLCIFEV